ncbi:hypothetical protein MHBO_000110 [Bonamia ostreae]|uniref:Translocon-associated protein subunit beta n=1 Tax=Bonamia ostreae TaxID=126728 RepID=A0ABV2AF40_9EUKA
MGTLFLLLVSCHSFLTVNKNYKYSDLAVGSPIEVSIDIFNKGKLDVSDVFLRIGENRKKFIVDSSIVSLQENGDLKIEKIKQGESFKVRFNLIPNQVGKFKAEHATLSYTENGKTIKATSGTNIKVLRIKKEGKFEKRNISTVQLNLIQTSFLVYAGFLTTAVILPIASFQVSGLCGKSKNN